MKQTKLQNIRHFFQFLPIAGLLWVSRLLPLDVRSALAGRVVGFVARWIPSFRNRIEEGLALVYPEMTQRDRGVLAGKVGRNMGRTLAEILHNQDFATQIDRFHVSGPGLDILKQAKKDGRGALIVSAHFGQWEAIRHVLMAQGLETGAVYRPNNNPWYEAHFLRGIQKGGAPILPKGRAGTKEMYKHVRKGGFFAILADQSYYPGQILPFLGHPAETTTAPADLALKLNLVMVTAFGTRAKNGLDIKIEFEGEIEHTDAVTMMTEFNNRVAKRIHARPEQWYWLHRRWKR